VHSTSPRPEKRNLRFSGHILDESFLQQLPELLFHRAKGTPISRRPRTPHLDWLQAARRPPARRRACFVLITERREQACPQSVACAGRAEDGVAQVPVFSSVRISFAIAFNVS